MQNFREKNKKNGKESTIIIVKQPSREMSRTTFSKQERRKNPKKITWFMPWKSCLKNKKKFSNQKSKLILPYPQINDKDLELLGKLNQV